MFTPQDNFLVGRFQFADFRQAWAFMCEVAFEAEAAQHHPNWENVYNQVVIKLTTHDAGNVITQKDYDLAAAIIKISKKYLIQ